MANIVIAIVLSCVLASVGLQAAIAEQSPHPIIKKGLVDVKLRQRGALLVDGFDGAEIDEEQWRNNNRINDGLWRVWISDEDKVKFSIKDGRYYIDGHGRLFHNGLWSMPGHKYKDVLLVARMDIRSKGPDPHECILHFCGGDMPLSPDHWVEICMMDQDDEALFKVCATLPKGMYTQWDRTLVLPRKGDGSFIGKVELDAGTNLCTAAVWDGKTWRHIIDPVELPLRTTHCEIKMRRQWKGKGPGDTKSTLWFDDVRIYPRPQTHPLMVRIVLKDGSYPWYRGEGESWPPKIHVAGQKERSIEDLVVQLWTVDGKTMVAQTQSQHMGHYMLKLANSPWNLYPVSAKIRLVLDGKVLGREVLIEAKGMEGMYPDDVWDLIME
jgi:hypothetical protein